MEWNRKYNYPTSTRALFNGKRHYQVNNERLPSVTSILSATMPLEKREGLKRWENKVGKKQAQIIKKEAGTRGTSLHEILEKWIKGKLNLDLLGDNTREKMMADEIIENGLKNKLNVIWGCEETLYFPEKYAGAADLIAGDYEGKSCIIDFKNASKPRQDHWNDEYYLQLSGYIAAHNEVYRTSINQGIILLCTKDFFFQKFIIEGDRLKEYENKFFERVEQYYSQKNN
tara:strand:- start:49 stop:735 length:687 start_codon:yes stop_codon:yes gene_type:complete